MLLTRLLIYSGTVMDKIQSDQIPENFIIRFEIIDNIFILKNCK